MNEERILEPKELGEDNIQKSLRPRTFKEYIGQQDLKEKMNIFIKQCKNTRDFSRDMNCTKILVSIQGNLYVDTEQNRAIKKLNCWELLKLV